MDVALVLARLVPAAQYGGCLTGNTRKEFEALRWEDPRPKPVWDDLVAAWPVIEAEIEKKKAETAIIEQRLNIKNFARILLMELNAIRAGQPRPAEVTGFVNAIKDLL